MVVRGRRGAGVHEPGTRTSSTTQHKAGPISKTRHGSAQSLAAKKKEKKMKRVYAGLKSPILNREFGISSRNSVEVFGNASDFPHTSPGKSMRLTYH